MSLDFNDPQLSSKMQPTIVKTRQGPVEYADFGAGKVVVTVHGAMGGYDQSIILPQVIGSPEYRYLAVTRPGYLGTPISSGKSPAQQGDLIAALLDELEIDKAGVFAVSGGGPSAVEFGLRHPDRCSGLVLAATNAVKVKTRIPISFKIMTFLARSPKFVEKFRKKAEQDLEAVAARSIRDPEILKRTINDADTWPLFCALMLSTYNRMNNRLIGTENDIRISATAEFALEELGVPVLAIHGTVDQLVNYEIQAKAYASRTPNCELVSIEGGEHVSIFTHRKVIREKVAEFSQQYF